MKTNCFIFLLTAIPTTAFAQASADKLKFPDQYTLDYPPAEKFCPPIRSTFFEVTRRYGVVGRKRFRQKPNGGYGLPIVDKVDGKNLIHVGADLGWYQVGEPVFAVAAGIVRLSIGPAKDDRDAPEERRARAVALPWGNLVVIEHRLPDDAGFVTTVYGHLDSVRLVRVGDVVEAGQPIGTIGKKNLKINGGYNPHLHFGVREGRIAEKGMMLCKLTINGKQHSVTVAEIGEDAIQINMPDIVPDGFTIASPWGKHVIEKRDGKFFLPASLLWQMQRPDFAIVGYALSKSGWLDPVAFLRERRADRSPAPFQNVKPSRR